MSASRMNKLRKFVKSIEFDECLVKACVSSVPRWRYIRELDLDPAKKTSSTDEGAASDSEEEFQFVSD